MVQPRSRRWAVGLLGFCLAVPLALVATPASAVEADSIPVTALGACGDIATPQKGGWVGTRNFLSTRVQGASPYALERPLQVRLDELCTSNNTTVGLRYYSAMPASWPNTGLSTMRYGAWTGVVKWECYNSANAPVTFDRTGFSSFLQPVEPTYVRNAVATFDVPVGCVRLRQFTLDVVPIEGVAGTSGNPSVPYVVTWSATRSLQNIAYDNAPPANLPGICADETIEWISCEAIRAKNRAAWGDTCGDAANADVYGVEYPGTVTLLTGEFDVTAWFTWHMACLFVPLAGFDADAQVATAWAASPNAEIGDQLVGLSDSFAYAPGCGVLAATPGSSPLPGFALDTCTWTWASPVKVVLGIGVLLLGFWAFIAYCVRAVSGVIRKDVPSPVEAS